MKTCHITWFVVLSCVILCNIQLGNADCAADCDKTGGQCTDGVCYCNPGFAGNNCTQGCGQACNTTAGEVCVWMNNTAACTSCPYCTDPFGTCMAKGEGDLKTPVCYCNDGYTGDNCTQCSSDVVCKNNGVCNDDNECECTKDWTGMYCQLECEGGCSENQICSETAPDVAECILDCSIDDVCGNGTCADGACQCMDNNAGVLCQLKCDPGCKIYYEMCVSMDNDTMAECQCQEGLSGDDCMTVSCDGTNPCQNEATCTDATCQCGQNFAGMLCEKECTPECTESQQCQEGEDQLECKENSSSRPLITNLGVLSLLIIISSFVSQQ